MLLGRIGSLEANGKTLHNHLCNSILDFPDLQLPIGSLQMRQAFFIADIATVGDPCMCLLGDLVLTRVFAELG